MSKENKVKETRCGNWTIVVYPDSAPDNWRDVLDDLHIEWVESPLHDKDINANGEPKKAHWHVLLMFSGVKSYEQVVELVEPLCCPIPTRVHNCKALVRYMAHLDNPDKAQYSIKEVISHGGVDVSDLLKPSASERYTYIKEMRAWCDDAKCTEFHDLFDYAAEFRFDDWFPLLCDSCAFVMDKYITSRRHHLKLNKDSSVSGCPSEVPAVQDTDGNQNGDSCQSDVRFMLYSKQFDSMYYCTHEEFCNSVLNDVSRFSLVTEEDDYSITHTYFLDNLAYGVIIERFVH